MKRRLTKLTAGRSGGILALTGCTGGVPEEVSEEPPVPKMLRQPGPWWWASRRAPPAGTRRIFCRGTVRRHGRRRGGGGSADAPR